MSKVEELQNAFEDLLTQLERLKKLNNITNANSNLAKKTIAEVKDFVNSVSEFKRIVDSDYEEKSKSLSKLEASLSATREFLEHKISKEALKFEEIEERHVTRMQEILNEAKNELNLSIKKYEHRINALENNIQSNLISLITERNAEINSNLSELNKGLKKTRGLVTQLKWLAIILLLSLGIVLYKVGFH
jgi:hypothetical protein